MNCFRYLDFKSLAQVDRLTIPEYELLMEAVRLKQTDMDYRNHLQAWLTFAAKAKRRSGRGEKPVYSKFSRFYDYEKQLEKAKNGNKQSCFSGIGRLLRKER